MECEKRFFSSGIITPAHCLSSIYPEPVRLRGGHFQVLSATEKKTAGRLTYAQLQPEKKNVFLSKREHHALTHWALQEKKKKKSWVESWQCYDVFIRLMQTAADMDDRGSSTLMIWLWSTPSDLSSDYQAHSWQSRSPSELFSICDLLESAAPLNKTNSNNNLLSLSLSRAMLFSSVFLI